MEIACGLKPEFLAAEHGAEPAEAADHLVVDHEYVVPLADRHDLFEIGFRRHDHAAGAHHRLGDERRHRFRPFFDDQRIELGGKARCELLLALAGFGEAVGLRTAGVQKAGQRQVEIAVVAGQAGERGGDDGDAVIGFHPADDFFLPRPAERVVEIPDELDLRVVRLRSGIAEKNLRDRHRRDLLEFLRKLDRRVVALAGEQMGERKLAHLRGSGLDQLLIAVAERRAPQPGHALDVGLALGVVDIDALPALDDQRTGLAKAREIDVGMHQRFDVAGRKVAQRGHAFAFAVPFKIRGRHCGAPRRRPSKRKVKAHDADEI